MPISGSQDDRHAQCVGLIGNSAVLDSTVLVVEVRCTLRWLIHPTNATTRSPAYSIAAYSLKTQVAADRLSRALKQVISPCLTSGAGHSV
jgi:hypothetical protein